MIATISALVLALLLAVASPADAECAWVLWCAVNDATTNERVWHIVNSFPSTKISQSGVTVDVGWKLCTNERDAAVKQIANQPELKSPYVACLPDTVDPRGPKGGGR